MQDDVCVYSVDLLNKHFVHRGIAKKNSGLKCQILSRNYDTFYHPHFAFPENKNKYWASNKIQIAISKILERERLKSRPENAE